MSELESSQPEPSDFEAIMTGIEKALQESRHAFEARLTQVVGCNYGSLEANRTVATLIQDIADRLHIAFVCTKCSKPARFRCSQGNIKTGVFTFAHSVGTHTGTASIPQLTLVAKPPHGLRARQKND
jgi:hypothetical protein